VTACVRVPDGQGGRQVETRRFTTTTAGLVLLAEWLASFGVSRVAMESTGCYWKPVWQLLEGQLECWLLNAAHLHNVPGRKTDVADAAWIAQLDSARAGPSQLCAAPADPGAARADRLPQDPDPRTHPGGPAAGQGPAGRRDPSCPAWPPTSSACPAGRCWKPWWPAPRTQRCWPGWPRVRLRAKLPALREALAGRVPHRPPRAAGRPDPGPHRLPRRDHRHPRRGSSR
jgi:hypothetical protein